jgi:hypothetical protein
MARCNQRLFPEISIPYRFISFCYCFGGGGAFGGGGPPGGRGGVAPPSVGVNNGSCTPHFMHFIACGKLAALHSGHILGLSFPACTGRKHIMPHVLYLYFANSHETACRMLDYQFDIIN